MKKILLCLALSMAAFAASAGEVNKLFVITPTNVVSFENVRSVNYLASGYLQLVYANSSVTQLADPTKAIHTKFKQSALAMSYIKVGSSDRYVRADMSVTTVCQNAKTVIGWANAGSEEVDDGCQLFYAIKATAQ